MHVHASTAQKECMSQNRFTLVNINFAQYIICIGGSRGGVPDARPPMGSNSFIFAYIFTEKCPRRRSTPPLTGACPPTGNPGSATDMEVQTKYEYKCVRIIGSGHFSKFGSCSADLFLENDQQVIFQLRHQLLIVIQIMQCRN